jgi:hypothetical protein
MIGSLYRSVAHALLAIGEYEQAVALTRAVSDGLQSSLGAATPEYLSVYGTLQLVGVVAAARQDNRTDATTFLAEASNGQGDHVGSRSYHVSAGQPDGNTCSIRGVSLLTLTRYMYSALQREEGAGPLRHQEARPPTLITSTSSTRVEASLRS